MENSESVVYLQERQATVKKDLYKMLLSVPQSQIWCIWQTFGQVYLLYIWRLFRICAEGSSYKEPRSSQSSKTPVLDCKFRDMWQIFLLIPLPGRRQKLVYTEHYFAALAAKAQYHKIGRQEQQDWQREQVHGVQNQVGILQVSSCLTLPCVVVHSRPSFRLGCSIWAAGCAGGVSNPQLLLQDEIRRGGNYRDCGAWGGLGGVAVGDPI